MRAEELKKVLLDLYNQFDFDNNHYELEAFDSQEDLSKKTFILKDKRSLNFYIFEEDHKTFEIFLQKFCKALKSLIVCNRPDVKILETQFFDGYPFLITNKAQWRLNDIADAVSEILAKYN